MCYLEGITGVGEVYQTFSEITVRPTISGEDSSIKWLLPFRNPETQLAWWIERLQSSSHGNADAISRRPCNLECRHCSKAEAKEEIIVEDTWVSLKPWKN